MVKTKKEGEGSSERQEIEIVGTEDTLEKSVIFHLLKEIISFVLYMHQQIPAVLQEMTSEFESMHTERKELETALAQREVRLSARRQHNGRMREVKQGIRRLEKLMRDFSRIQTALQLMLNEVHGLESVVLILGGSPLRPQHVYEMSFSHGRIVEECTMDYTKSRIADALSRKALRALISNGAGSVSYSGQTKLFLLVKAPATLNMPLHFLPKRDFKFHKKVVPFRLRVKCSIQGQNANVQHQASNDSIWFQCKHTIKGLPSSTPTPDE
ncbi:hypothetical protein C5167_014270 [Papaver somniferum]|uniref:Uncharacterized protein n=1 Tax=Papaver somniferum TaxID=3469 RepID=A0A4Y7J5T3_PAPSO|nr:uncharacterized protein LOC113361628 [Papaver somniferum]RZC55410.1 hypothetical protein C5167_014270 [Papaver somniferum]